MFLQGWTICMAKINPRSYFVSILLWIHIHASNQFKNTKSHNKKTSLTEK